MYDNFAATNDRKINDLSEGLVMNFDIPSENGLIGKYCGQSPEVSQSVRNSSGWEECLPENVPEFESILWSLGVCTNPIYNL